MDSNPPPLITMSVAPSTEGAVPLQGTVTSQQYVSPDVALQFSADVAQQQQQQTGGMTVVTCAAPLPLVSSTVETVVVRVTSGLEVGGRPAGAPETSVGLGSQLAEMNGALAGLEASCQLPVASAAGDRETADAYPQANDGPDSNAVNQQGGDVGAAFDQVQAADPSEASDLTIQVDRVQGGSKLAPPTETSVEMEVQSCGDADDGTDTSMQQQQQQQHGEEAATVEPLTEAGTQPADSKEVIFVCIHGQPFRCRPQEGIPVESPEVKEPPPEDCACSKSKKPATPALPLNPAVVKGGKLALKLRSRKQLFACGKCGGRFSQHSALELHMLAHEGEEEEEEEAEEDYYAEIDADEETAGDGEGTTMTEDVQRRPAKRGRPPKKLSKGSRAKTAKTCPECDKTFAGHRALAMHRRQHRREKTQGEEDGVEGDKGEGKAARLSCTVCQKTFTRSYDVERHMETQHVDADRKKCGGCGKEFHTIKSRERHESLHCELKRQNKCGTCQLVFGSKFKLLRHEREHLSSEELSSLSCKACAKVFTNGRSLFRHEKLHLKEKGSLIACAACPETFEDRYSYNAHRKAHAVKAFQCRLCSLRFKHEYLLNIHLKRRTCQKKRESLRDVECGVCRKVVKGTATLKRHMRTHTKEKPYPCRIGCTASFSSTSNRLSHERMYCKLSPSYLCTHCGEVLSNQSKLIYHESKFHGIGPIVGGQRTPNTEYPCRHCGKVFFFKGGRKRHERIHTNEKPFMCQFCPKAFVHASALVCHERVHTNERPYICDECGKAFSQATHLKTHIRVHTKEKPYKCRHCEKAFSHMGTRKSHEGTHKNTPDAPGMQAVAQAAGPSQVPAKFHLPLPQQQQQQQVQHLQQVQQQVQQQVHQQGEQLQPQHVVVHQEIKVVHPDAEPVPHKIHVSHHEHEVQAADVILQLLESGSRVPNFEGLVNMASS